jgi:hypothetical protein
VLRYKLGREPSGTVDVLLDTTSSVPNEHFLLTVGSPSPAAVMIASELAEMLKCETLS